MLIQEDPKIGCIIINYNKQNTLHRSINSALNQSSQFDQIIVMDEASNDDSVSVLKTLIGDNPNVLIVENKKKSLH